MLSECTSTFVKNVKFFSVISRSSLHKLQFSDTSATVLLSSLACIFYLVPRLMCALMMTSRSRMSYMIAAKSPFPYKHKHRISYSFIHITLSDESCLSNLNSLIISQFPKRNSLLNKEATKPIKMEIEFEETKLNFPEIKYECEFTLPNSNKTIIENLIFQIWTTLPTSSKCFFK